MSSVLCFSNSIRKSPEFPELEEIARDKSCKIAKSLVKNLTHYVTNEMDQTDKLESRPNVHIVSPEFLLKWSKQQEKPNEADFYITKAPLIKQESKAEHNEKQREKRKREEPQVVDIYCPIKDRCHVYQDNDAIYDVMLNQTNIASNNNKFYLLQVLKDDNSEQYHVWFRWGRVGYTGQHSLIENVSLANALNEYKSKFFAKTLNRWEDRNEFQKHQNKYFLLERDHGPDLEKPEKVDYPDSNLHPRLQELMKLIFNTSMMEKAMAEIGYDLERMPLGKLTKDHYQKGYQVLSLISKELESASQQKAALMELSSQFYTVIPHSFGMKVPPLISSKKQVKEKLEMLESLQDIEIATKIIDRCSKIDKNPIDSHYESLGCYLNPMEKSDPMFTVISDYLQLTHAPTHEFGLDLLDVFSIDSTSQVSTHNTALLWHGSRITNFVGILSQGLRIAPPGAPVTGYMFGRGVYFADMATKSANYCCTSKRNDTGLMLLCQVGLGDILELEEAEYDADKIAKRNLKHSTKGLGKTMPDPTTFVKVDDMLVPCGKPVNSGRGKSLLYNEYIVYNTSQIKLKYLVKVKFNY